MLSQMEEVIDQSVFPRGKPADSEMPAVREQYKLVVEMWDRVRARRQQTNAFYLTINSGLLVATMTIATAKDVVVPRQLSIGLDIVGFFICLLWIVTIDLYRLLTDRKKRIITLMEKTLPAAPFSAELSSKGGLGFTFVEIFVPLVFLVFYLFLAIRFGSADFVRVFAGS